MIYITSGSSLILAQRALSILILLFSFILRKRLFSPPCSWHVKHTDIVIILKLRRIRMRNALVCYCSEILIISKMDNYCSLIVIYLLIKSSLN